MLVSATFLKSIWWMFTPLPCIDYSGTPPSTCSLHAENSEQPQRTIGFKKQEFTTTLVSSLHSDHSLNTCE